MKFTPASTATRSAMTDRVRSGGGPQAPGPVMRIAPNPIRFTTRPPSLPIVTVPAAAAPPTVTGGGTRNAAILGSPAGISAFIPPHAPRDIPAFVIQCLMTCQALEIPLAGLDKR